MATKNREVTVSWRNLWKGVSIDWPKKSQDENQVPQSILDALNAEHRLLLGSKPTFVPGSQTDRKGLESARPYDKFKPIQVISYFANETAETFDSALEIRHIEITLLAPEDEAPKGLDFDPKQPCTMEHWSQR